MSCRALAQYNGLLARYYPAEVEGMNSGIGPIIHQGQVGYVKPRNLISTSVGQTIQNLDFGQKHATFQAVWVPSEANSEVAVYWKENKVLFSAEVIQDHSFPNLYTLRGANFRDPSYWAAAIDTFLTQFSDAVHMVLQHGPPIIGGSYEGVTISEIWTRYRDAIQYVHDQTLRFALKGYSKDEIMHIVNLPHQQATFSPWLQEFYGTVRHSVPAVYTGYIGWFDGDPIELMATPRSEYAARVIALMGGQEAVLKTAIEIFLNAGKPVPGLIQPTQEKIQKDYQFAAELATLIIRQNPLYEHDLNPEQVRKEAEAAVVHKGCQHHQHRKEGDKTWWEARFLKAAIFKQFAYTTICANWRGTYLTAAHELEGVDLLSQITNKLRIGFLQPAATKAMSVDESVLELQVRLNAEKAALIDNPKAPLTVIKLGLQVQNTPAGVPTGYLLFIRNCVLVVQTFSTGGTGAIAGADATIVADIGTINVLLSGNNVGGYNAILQQTPPTEQQKEEFKKLEAQFKGKITPALHEYPITYVSDLADPASAAVDFFSYFDQGRYIESPNIYLH
jgi:alkyl sulfatase BDS1-like metallo-beta-lactamase superfamily hydrolase